MVIQFKNTYLQRLFEGKAVPGKPRYSGDVITKFKKTVLRLQYADNLREIRSLKGLNFEALKGDLKGSYSVRVDRSYRLILTIDIIEEVKVTEIISVHDLNNHYP